MTIFVDQITQWREVRKTLGDKTVGLITTMGNLHDGHRSLMQRSVKENDVTVLTCFVNPTQFNNSNDLENYPRTEEADRTICAAEGVDYFFSPSPEAMYPDDYCYKVSEKKMSSILEGEHRPGHFDGALTIVLKFLLLVKPHRTYFGEKDYQQLQLVQGMAKAFLLETEVVACKTIRTPLQLALSSRNGRLTEDQMAIASIFPEYLQSNRSCEDIAEALKSKGFEVEYIQEHEGRRFGAVRLGDVRLIDNVEV